MATRKLELLTADDVAAQLGVGKGTILLWVRKRMYAFPAPIRVGRQLRWFPDALETWLGARANAPAPQREERVPALLPPSQKRARGPARGARRS